MRKRIVIRITIAALLLLGSLALLQASGRLSLDSQSSAQAQSNEPLSDQYSVEKGVASGGGYHLTGLARQVNDTSSGGQYRLLGPASPSLDLCCCVHLPCIRR